MKNKKKLLIAVAAMGLLAVGTAGVGTAAWFQATTTGNIKQVHNTTETVAVSEVNASVGDVLFPILDVDISFATAGSADLELAAYLSTATGTKKLGTGYRDDGNGFHSLGVDGSNNGKTAGVGHVLYGTVTVTITRIDASTVTVGGVVYNTNDYAKALRSHTVDIKITPSGRARVFETNAAEGDPDTAVTISDFAISTLINESTGAKIDTSVVKTCYAYVYGGETTGTISVDYRDTASGVAAQGLRVDLKDHSQSWE